MNFARPLLAALASMFVSSAPAAALTALRRRAVPCLAALACALAWPASLAAQSAPTVAPATAIGLTGFTANWSAVSGATGYRIDVATNSEFTGTLLVNNASVGALFYAIGGLSPATTYHYRVRAVGAATSANSAVQAVTTATFVPPLLQPATAITQTGFTATWATAIGATSYRIDVANTPDFSGTLIATNATASGTSYTASNLTAGTTYYYRVRSFGVGTSANSPVTAVRTLPFLTPVAHAANAVTTAGFTASWTAVAGATGYRIDVATAADFSGTLVVNNVAISNGSTITYAVTGLTPATTYHYRVRAVGPGTTPNSNVVAVTTAPFPAPVAQAASDVGYTNFTANWARVAGATGYRIDIATNPAFTGTLVASNVSVSSSTLSYNATGLALATTYHYRVRAVGLVTSPNSETIAVTTRSFTVVPVALAATDLDYTSFTANWARAAEATGYRLDVATTPDFSGTLVKNNVAHGASTFSSAITGLTPGTTYYYRVRAEGPITTANSNVITAVTTPLFATVPVSLAATNVSYTSFTANWARVPDVTGYRIDVSANPTFTGTLLANNVSVGAGTLSYNVTGLPLGTTYYYRVRAVAQSTSASSEVKSATTLTYAVPPVAVAATNVTTTGFTANWAELSGATDYFLDVATTANFSGTLVVANRGVNGAFSSNVTGLSAGMTYYYRVRAQGPALTPNSNVISVVATNVIHPNFGPTVALPATDLKHTSFTANWQRVADATAYIMDLATSQDFAEGTLVAGFSERGVGQGTSYSTANVSPTLLTPGTTYYYRIKVRFVVVTTHANGTQTSSTHTYTSNTSSITTPVFTAVPVANAATDLNYTSLTANWSRVPDATGYRLDFATSADFAEDTLIGGFSDRGIGNVTSYPTSAVSTTLLTPGTTYYYRVRATGPANGLSASSNVVTVTTPIFTGTPVAQPATAVDYQTFTANWTPVPEATSYRLDIATSADFAEGTLLGSFSDRAIGNVRTYSTTNVSSTLLTPGTTYYYRVRATGPANGLSASSNVVAVTTPIFTGKPVAQPASGVDFTTFTANWSLVPHATGYRLDIATSADFAEGTLLGSFSDRAVGNVTTYSTTSVSSTLLTPGTTYYYRVRATGPANGLSAHSNVVSVTTLAMNGAPTALPATGLTPTDFAANWTALNEATGYELDIATSADFAAGTYLANFEARSVGNVTTYQPASTVGALPPGTTYYYRVRARGPAGSVSPASNVVTVTTYRVPAITTHPAGVAAHLGSAASFTVIATGVPAPAYQWRKNSLDLPGATAATLTLPAVALADTASYTVEVRSDAGSLVSHPASLVVHPGNVPGYAWTTFAGLAGSSGNTNATGTAARFSSPTGLAVDAAGHFYLADTANHVIRKLSPTGEVTTLAGLAGSSGSDDGAGSIARFSSPEGLAVDATGHLYVADTGNHLIRRITPAGLVTTLAGLPGSSGSTDGTGSAARFDTPRAVAVDATGHLYIADYANHVIRKITPAGAVTTFAGLARTSGTADGTGGTARFNGPRGLALDSAGSLYVADYLNHAIRKLTPAGVVTTLAGLTGTPGFDDGTGPAARFRNPQGVAVDASGRVFVAEAGNHLVRRLSPDGIVVTLGGLATSTGSADGTGELARFNDPAGLVVDATGALVLADSDNHTLRRGLAPPAAAPVAPTIAIPPVSQTVFAGQSATFAVAATGSPLPTYQWRRGDTAISGATTATLVLTNVQSADAGDYTVVVANSAGSVTSAPAALTIAVLPAITGPATATAVVGTPFSLTLVATGTPTGFGATGLPLGLTLHAATGTISGTPAVAGVFPVALSATNPAGSGTATLTLTVGQAPAFTSAAAATFAAGQPGTFTVAASGSPAPTFSVAGGTLPAWATLNATTGVLAGTPPSASGSPFTFTLAAANGIAPAAAQIFVLTVSGPAAPVIVTHPAGRSVSAGTAVTFTVAATGTGPLGYQWRKNGTPLAGATTATLAIASAQTGDAADYTVAVSNLGGTVLSQTARLALVPPGTFGTHAVVAGGYRAGSTVTITNTLTYPGTATALGWQVLLPAGWTYASSDGAAGDTRPAAGATSLLEWAWTAIPPSPVTFTYTLNVPAGQTGPVDLVALAIVRLGDNPLSLLAQPDPLVVNPAATHHDADTDRNLALDLSELTHVIALYNVRNANLRTGAYVVATATTEDGFAPDATRLAGASAALARYHSADSNRDARFSLVELTRVIELYNTRAGTVRTGLYHVQAGTEDGFAPGP